VAVTATILKTLGRYFSHRVVKGIWILPSFWILTGCSTNNELTNITVVPEQVMEVSSDHVRLSGRIIASTALNISDHGFEISENSDFSNPVTISLGSRTNPGRFFGETGGLKINTKYQWRPFLTIGSSRLTGETSSFATSPPSIIDFEPKQGLEGTIISIEGANFTNDIEVKIDGRPALITDKVLDNKLVVKVPPLKSNRFATVELFAQDTTLTFTDLFEYVVGKWDLLDQFVTSDYYSQTLNMRIGDQVLIGMGLKNFGLSSEMWLYDLTLGTWTSVPFAGTLAKKPFQAAPYFGGGNVLDKNGVVVNSNEFYKYENNQIVSVGITPFRLRRSIAFVWNNNLYIYGGELESGFKNLTIHKYDPSANLWSEIGTSPFPLDASYPYFQYLDNEYYINSNGEVIRHTPETTQWDVIANFPSAVLENGISQVIGNKAYIGIFEADRSLTEYDIDANTWLKKKAFPGSFLEETGGSWVYNGQLFLLKNQRIIERKPMNMWSFSPDEF